MRQRLSTLAVCLLMSPFAFTSASAEERDFSGQWAKVKVGGKICFADHAHGGLGMAGTKKIATRLAIASWVQSIRGEYAKRWDNWGNTVGKSVNCTGGTDTYTCTVSARPCAKAK